MTMRNIKLLPPGFRNVRGRLIHLVTLPVELDASRRALAVLSSNGMMDRDEVSGARKVLGAAAMTYLAAALQAVLSLVRLILLRNSRSRD